MACFRRIKGSNLHQQIKALPDDDDDVTVVLPGTTSHAYSSAMCTDDGRKLSNFLDFVVNVPG